MNGGRSFACLLAISSTILFLILGCSACRLPDATASKAGQKNEPAFIFALRGDSAPTLSTNEVMQIAMRLAESRRFKLNFYTCGVLAFEGNAPDSPYPNKWLVHFSEKPPTPDTDFFVIIDDDTGDAELHHY